MSVQLHSIKGYNSFRKIYDVGMRFRSNNASATVVFSEVFFSEMIKTAVVSSSETSKKSNNNAYCGVSNDGKHIIYYGVAVGKKVAKKAVVRNRIKRLMRESLRIAVKKIEVEKKLPIKKIIISYHSAPKHPMQIGLNNVLPAVENLLKQAYLYYVRINKNNSSNENNTSQDCNISDNSV